MATRLSKRHKANLGVAPQQPLSPSEACEAVKKYKGPKFDQTVNVVMHLGIDAAQADQAIRGSVSLPNGIGKAKRVIAFCREDAKAARVKASGRGGADDLVAKVEAGGWTLTCGRLPDMMHRGNRRAGPRA